MSKVFLSIGGNLGDRKKNLKATQSAVALKAGEIKLFSPIYESEAWGFKHEKKFYNQVIMVETGLDPDLLMTNIIAIENLLGKDENKKNNDNQQYSARSVDIDILLFDDKIINKENLSIPHPHLPKRLFVLKPLNDIAPDLIHPLEKKNISVLLDECKDKGKIEKTDIPENLILYG